MQLSGGRIFAEAREVCLSAAGTISAKAKLHRLCVAARATPPISISKVPAKI